MATKSAKKSSTANEPVVKVGFDKGIAWVTLNRPEKRNAMSPTLNDTMHQVLNDLEGNDLCKVLVLTGAGDAFSAGMDLQEYFRVFEDKPRIDTIRARRSAMGWWTRLMYFEKPTIAMVNGWCFGGAFTPVFACDLAVAADESTFGLSEVNWGIVPAGNVTRAVAATMSHRDSLYYLLTGETFKGKEAATMGFVNESVPLKKLKSRVRELAETLMKKNPMVLKAIKDAYRHVKTMPWDTSADYLNAKQEQLWHIDKSEGRKQGQKQFLDDKTYKPGLGEYKIKAAAKKK